MFESTYPCERAIERIAATGFDGIDMGFDRLEGYAESPMWGVGWREYAASLREKADGCGIGFTHAHAPWNRFAERFFERCVEAAHILGAGFIVVHPVESEADGTPVGSAEDFVRRNARIIYPRLEVAEKFGVVLLAENLHSRFSRDVRNVARLVEAVGSEHFGWCLDVGHMHIAGFSPETLGECASAPRSLHLHDNFGKNDDHMIPGAGKIDFDALIAALRRVGYAGDCVLEAFSEVYNAKDGDRDPILRRLLAAGKSLRAKFES